MSLKITVPLILLGFAAILSIVNVVHYVPQVEHAVEEDTEKRLAQEMSRLQSTLEYLILKGETVVAEHEIEALAHNHEVNFAVLTNDRGDVIAATRRAWLGRPVMEVLPGFARPSRRRSRACSSSAPATVSPSPPDRATCRPQGLLSRVPQLLREWASLRPCSAHYSAA